MSGNLDEKDDGKARPRNSGLKFVAAMLATALVAAGGALLLFGDRSLVLVQTARQAPPPRPDRPEAGPADGPLLAPAPPQTRGMAAGAACLQEIRRKATEKGGRYVETDATIRSWCLPVEEAAKLGVGDARLSAVREVIEVNGRDEAVSLTLQAENDPLSLRRRLTPLGEDVLPGARAGGRPPEPEPTRDAALEAQTKALVQVLLGEPAALSTKPAPAASPASSSPPARTQASQQPAAPTNPPAPSTPIPAPERVVEIGMTKQDVYQLLGAPNQYRAGQARGTTYECLGYGSAWVVFKDGQTACLRSRLQYLPAQDSDCHCAGLADTFLK